MLRESSVLRPSGASAGIQESAACGRDAHDEQIPIHARKPSEHEDRVQARGENKLDRTSGPTCEFTSGGRTASQRALSGTLGRVGGRLVELQSGVIGGVVWGLPGGRRTCTCRAQIDRRLQATTQVRHLDSLDRNFVIAEPMGG